jgi:methionyl-tRNA formyltransferase
MMRVLFMGSSDASVQVLRGLLKSPLLKIVGVVTQPDRPSGRKQQLTPCACKAFALEQKLHPLICPEKINAPEVLDQIRALKPDVIVVVAFGQFLGKTLLKIPSHGCINGHFSLLPQYRGASPVQTAIAAGEKETGVTIMQMDVGMDDGDILLQAIEPIYSDDTFGSLMDRLSILCAVVMVKALRLMINGKLPRTPQNHAGATYARKFEKHDGLINWNLTSAEIDRHLRAYDPWPGSFTFMPANLTKKGSSGRLKIIEALILKDADIPPHCDCDPGTVCSFTPMGPVVVTGDGALCLTVLQPEGSRAMDAHSFLNGHKLKIGDRLGVC